MGNSCLCCAVVSQADIAFVQSFGRYSRTLTPGLSCLNPCGESVAGTLSLRVQQLDVYCDTKTRDNVFVRVIVAVQFQVIAEQAFDAFYKLSNPHQQITCYVFDVVRATVPKLILDDVFEAKEELANAVKHELSESMSSFGYTILKTLIVDIDPDPKVKEAMNSINAAQRLRVAASDTAESRKIAVVKAAEADAESKYLMGVGIARQRKAIIEGLRDSVLEFSEHVKDTSPHEVMGIVKLTQYYDTLKDIGGHNRASVIFVPQSNMGIDSYDQDIHQGFTQGALTRDIARSIPQQ